MEYIEKISRMWDGFAGVDKVYDIVDDETKRKMEDAAEKLYKFVTEKSEGIDERFWNALSGAKGEATLMYLFDSVKKDGVAYDEVVEVANSVMLFRDSIKVIIDMYDEFFSNFRSVVYMLLSISDVDKILFMWAMNKINKKHDFDSIIKVLSIIDNEGCSICEIKKVVDDEELVKAYKIIVDIFTEVRKGACC